MLDDAEVVGDSVAELVPFIGQGFAEELQNSVGELVERGIVAVMRHPFVHDAPEAFYPLPGRRMPAFAKRGVDGARMAAGSATSLGVPSFPAMTAILWHDDSVHYRERRGLPSWLGCCVPTFSASAALSGR